MAERSMACFLGIDGGGTRNTAWLPKGDGKPPGGAENRPSNPLKVGFRAAEREIMKAFHACLREAGFPASAARASRPPLLEAVGAGIAGIDRRPAHRPLLAWIRRH